MLIISLIIISMNTKPLSQKMLRSLALVLAIAALLGFSGRAFAQNATVPYCQPWITSDLHIGQYDSYTSGQVTKLQTYLYGAGFMNHAPTGYFGGLTMQGVMQFQRERGIITTGYVGPLTRGALQVADCGGPEPISAVSVSSVTPSAAQVGGTVTLTGNGFTSFGTNTVHFGSGVISNVAPVTTSCPYPSFAPCYDTHSLTFTVPASISPYCAPGMLCAMYMQLVTPGTYPVYVTNSNGTSNTVYLVVTGDAASVSISGLDAPASIAVNTQGTWTIHASSASSNLHYSVVWGDEVMKYYSYDAAVSTSSTWQTSATFTHAYHTTGTFNPRFTVTDDQGRSATTSATVTVVSVY